MNAEDAASPENILKVVAPPTFLYKIPPIKLPTAKPEDIAIFQQRHILINWKIICLIKYNY